MKNKLWQQYRDLELIPDTRLDQPALPALPAPDPAASRSWLATLWQILDITFFRDLEPRVWQSQDQTGHTSWHLYNPETGKTIHLTSKTEVSQWLEQILQH